MSSNEIKKYCYRNNPKAELSHIRKGVAVYQCLIGEGTPIAFEVPVDDMGEASFFPEMEAKLLLRWLVN